MKRKIFISLNVPPRDKKRLSKAILEWQDLPVKWVKEPNFHLTLAFLGHVEDNAIPSICEGVSRAVEGKQIFDLFFSQIELDKKNDPKIIWLTGEASEELKNLQSDIEKELGIFVTEKKIFIPHITLGRIRKNKWEETENLPEIKKTLDFVLTVESVDVMASDFENEEQEYTIIESRLLDS